MDNKIKEFVSVFKKGEFESVTMLPVAVSKLVENGNFVTMYVCEHESYVISAPTEVDNIDLISHELSSVESTFVCGCFGESTR
jgi:hypothetical protein